MEVEASGVGLLGEPLPLEFEVWPGLLVVKIVVQEIKAHIKKIRA